jgi:hypothetical protein
MIINPKNLKRRKQESILSKSELEKQSIEIVLNSWKEKTKEGVKSTTADGSEFADLIAEDISHQTDLQDYEVNLIDRDYESEQFEPSSRIDPGVEGYSAYVYQYIIHFKNLPFIIECSYVVDLGKMRDPDDFPDITILDFEYELKPRELEEDGIGSVGDASGAVAISGGVQTSSTILDSLPKQGITTYNKGRTKMKKYSAGRSIIPGPSAKPKYQKESLSKFIQERTNMNDKEAGTVVELVEKFNKIKA